MNLLVANKIAKAVLYEGYMLYPYRPSSLKNRQRWNFGVLYPESYVKQQGGADRSWCQTECLMQTGFDGKLEIRVRFLHLVARLSGKLKERAARLEDISTVDFESAIVEETLRSWQEVEERDVIVALDRNALSQDVEHAFTFPSTEKLEAVADESGSLTAAILRQSETVAGIVRVSMDLSNDAIRLSVRLANAAPIATGSREEALKFSLISAHMVFGVEGGEFVSVLDPPETLRGLAAGCQNVGVWPVLVGEPGAYDTILVSPIILYDYPQVAPESAGDLFDGAEIDEILSLRILTMTDEEKHEMRASDDRARQILERVENMPPEQLMNLHGAIRSLRPLKEKAS